YTQKVTDLIQNVYADSIEAVNVSTGRITWLRQRQYQNVGSIRQHGWEFTGSLNVFRIGLRGTYSWNDSRVVAVNPTGSGAGSFYPGMSLQQVPTHIGHLSANYAHGPTTITLSSNYIGQSLQEGTDGLVSLGYDYARIRTYHSVTRRV